MKIIIYTDGAARGNPGPGGYGVVLKSGKHRKELSEGFRLTTNNRMELLAVIVGLETLKKNGSEVVIYSDSSYVVDAVEKKWLFGWEKKDFKKKKILIFGSGFFYLNDTLFFNYYKCVLFEWSLYDCTVFVVFHT